MIDCANLINWSVVMEKVDPNSSHDGLLTTDVGWHGNSHLWPCLYYQIIPLCHTCKLIEIREAFSVENGYMQSQVNKNVLSVSLTSCSKTVTAGVLATGKLK